MKKPKPKYAVRTFRDGSKEWSRDGKLHRDGDLPASEGADGTRMWFRDGKRHRDGDLPAVVWADGRVEFWVDGKRVYR